MSSENEISVSASVVDSQQEIVGVSVRSRESFFLPASELQEYDNLCPGSAQSLLAAFEKQVYHRMEMEKSELERQEKTHHGHLALGVLTLLIFAGSALVFGFLGMEKAAMTAIGCPALYGLGSLLHSRHKPDN
jgi:uncharacterized membrane protein